MKQVFIVIIIIMLNHFSGAVLGQANQSLSNLVSPTAINQHMLPGADNLRDAGSAAAGWRNFYLSGSIFRGTGRIFSANSNNLAVGLNALNTNTGIATIAIGNNALFSSATLGSNNIAVGFNALYTSTTGTYNIGIGNGALYSATNAFGNIAIGNEAMRQNISGQRNVAVGFESLRSGTTASFNTAVGYIALKNNTTGNGNTALGYAALLLNTSGRNNTASGDSALYNNTTGLRNTATGAFSLWHNTTGGDNAAFGLNTLAANTTGHYNAAIGSQSLFSNTNGYYNTAMGYEALLNNTTAYHNTALGAKALRSNTTGYFNTAAGSNAGVSITSGHSNVAIGGNAMLQNRRGYSSVAIGKDALREDTIPQNTVAIGDSALMYNQSDTDEFYVNGNGNTAVGSKANQNNIYGGLNTAIGFKSLSKPSGAFYTTAVGVQTLRDLREGSFNTALGADAGAYLVSGEKNTFLGYLANTDADNAYASVAVGALSTISASFQVRVGDGFTASIGGSVDWTTFSDGRFKKQLKENVPGLSFINRLKAVTYIIDTKAFSNYMHKNNMETFKKAGIDFDKLEIKSMKGKYVYSGFIAQEVEQAAQSLNYDFSGVDAPKNESDYYGLRYAQFVVPLVKAVQELSEMNEEKDAEIDTLKQAVIKQEKINNDLQRQLTELKALVLSIQQCSPCNASAATAVQSHNVVITDGILLEQNIPNPFSNTTTIGYTLPQKFTGAQIVMTDKTGRTIKTVNISGSGKGKLNVDAATLSSGAYQYALIVNGKLVGSKQMVLTR